MMVAASENEKKRILCVDDDEVILQILENLFKDTPYLMKYETNGKDGYDEIHSWKPHLVILDIDMPEIDGFQVLDMVAEKIQLEQLHVVVLSGLKKDQQILKGYKKGAVYYITKPFPPERITNIVSYLIGDCSKEERSRLETLL